MTDSLRTRIAAAIEAQHVSEYQGGIHPEDVLRLADAVIAVLTESATECWDQWPARRCVILGTADA